MITQSGIESYIKAHELSWAATSLKSEQSRLEALLTHIGIMDDPASLYKELIKTKKPYTVKTTFIRLADYYDYIKAPNIYREFLDSHRNLFKNVYTTERLQITYAQACKQISKITDESLRAAATFLISSGARISEISQVTDNTILGKGGKRRALFGAKPVKPVCKKALWRALREVGLKPHSLRKLFATRLLERGVGITDICHILGWESFETAKRYMQPSSDKMLTKLVLGAVNAN